jgi:UDP-2,3-diacylglucosamine hydrolase
MMRPIYFISDAHLSFDHRYGDAVREKYLLNFLDQVESNGDGLFILGDLFDFWFEYRYVIPSRYFAVLAALKRCSDRGMIMGYVTGNHDFWIGDFFRNELNIPVYADHIDITLQGKHLYISHGDGLSPRDKGYRILKRILRHPMNIRLYQLLHPDLGFRLAGFFSRLSRDHRLVKDRDEEYIGYAQDLFRRGFDGVVMGHTHRPMELRESGNVYINLGEWMSGFTYGTLKNGNLSLEYWPLPDKAKSGPDTKKDQV